jgi:hypothetical protein
MLLNRPKPLLPLNRLNLLRSHKQLKLLRLLLK